MPGLWPGLLDHFIQKQLGHIGFQQTFPVFAECVTSPHPVIQIHAYEPAETDAVVDIFHQEPFAAH